MAKLRAGHPPDPVDVQVEDYIDDGQQGGYYHPDEAFQAAAQQMAAAAAAGGNGQVGQYGAHGVQHTAQVRYSVPVQPALRHNCCRVIRTGVS